MKPIISYALLLLLLMTAPVMAQDKIMFQNEQETERTTTQQKNFEEIQQAERMQAAAQSQMMAAEQRAQNPIQIFGAESASATFTGGDIHTELFGEGFTSCNEALTVNIPDGSVITGVDVSYDMESDSGGWISEQRSIIRAVGGEDSEVFSGPGTAGEGTFNYSHTGLDIANGITGGGDIVFEFYGFRTWPSDETGCNKTYQFVPDGTWSVTVHYDIPGAITNPTAFTANALSDSQINLSWDLNAEEDDIILAWNTEDTFGEPAGTYSPGATIAGGGSVLAAGNATTFDHSSLDENTTYYYKIWSESGGVYSGGVATQARTQLSPITDFPFVESFEESSETRDGWSQIQESGSGSWAYASGSSGGLIGSAFDGDLNARFVSVSGSDSPITKLVSPVMDLSSLENARLTFYYAQEAWFGDQNELIVYYRESASNDWSELSHYTDNTDSWTEVVLNLPNPSTTYQIAFEGINNWGRANVVDLVTVDDIPTTPVFSITPEDPQDFGTVNLDRSASESFAVTNVGVGSLSVNSAAISGPDSGDFSIIGFTAGDLEDGESLSFDVVFEPASEGAKEATLSISYDDGTVNTATVSLSGEGLDTSISELPYSENFSDVPLTELPEGWSRESNSSRPWGADNSPELVFSGNRGMATGLNDSSPKEEWLFTPPIEMEAGVSYSLSFYLKAPGFSGETDRIKVFASDTATPSGMLENEPLLVSDETIFVFTESEVAFTPSATGLYYFAWFNDTPVDDVNAVAIDEISVFETPTTPIFSLNPEDPQDFGTVNIGRSASESFTVTNVGVGSLSVNSAAISGPDSDVFSVDGFTASTLGAGESLSFDVVFTPATEVAKEATLTISYDDGTAGTATVALSGEGLDVTISDFPYSERFPVLDVPGSELTLHPSMAGWTSEGAWRQAFAGPRISETGWALTIEVASLTTPPIALPADSDFALSFWYRAEGSSNPVNIEVSLSTDGETFDTEILSLEGYADITYRQGTFDLSAFAGETVFIRFSRLPGSTEFWGWALDDLFIGPAVESQLVGEEGFFLIANPLEQNPIGNLLNPFWTQGFTGADRDTGDEEPNVFLLDEASNTFQAVSSADNMMTPGGGLAAYIFSDDNFNGTPDGFPKDITSVGPNQTGDITIEGTNDLQGWNLFGNPYATNIDLNNPAEFTDLTGFFYRWNNAEGRFEVFDTAQPGVPDTFNGVIKPFEGFLVEANGTDPSMTFKEDLGGAPSSPTTMAGGRKASEDTQKTESEDTPSYITFSLESDAHQSRTSLAFLSGYSPGREGASFLYPLSNDMTALLTASEDESFMIRYLDAEYSGEYSIPMGYYTTDEGDMTLSWELSENLPETWEIELYDRLSGDIIPLLPGEAYQFNAEKSAFMFEGPQHSANSGEQEEISEILRSLNNPAAKVDAADARFEVIIRMQPTSTGPGTELPEVLALNQNYPNPFNPTTQISYDLPENVDVRLDVFNIQGQRVATLVNASQNPGRYSISYNALNLSSGVYLYRLQAGREVLTRKMTLIK